MFQNEICPGFKGLLTAIPKVEGIRTYYQNLKKALNASLINTISRSEDLTLGFRSVEGEKDFVAKSFNGSRIVFQDKVTKTGDNNTSCAIYDGNRHVYAMQ